jgi:hypothetical protein
MFSELFDAASEYENEHWDDDESWDDEDDEDTHAEFFELADVLQDALSDDYADAEPEAVDNALADILDSMSPAESFDFVKALKQIGRTAGQVASDPMFKQVAATALPIAGGALGTMIGGPVGTALGSQLGSVAAGAIAGGAPRSAQTTSAPTPPASAPPQAASGPPQPAPGPPQPAPGPPQPVPAVANGSAAAAQGLVLTQQPDVLKSLLALSLGQHGKNDVNGVPVAQVMNMLASVFGQAAADADELMYLGTPETYSESREFNFSTDADEPVAGRELYAVLLGADNAEFDEALESL